MDTKLLHDLLSAMITQHGEQKVAAQLTKLHAEMSISSAKVAQKQAKECNRCGGDSGSGHYCM